MVSLCGLIGRSIGIILLGMDHEHHILDKLRKFISFLPRGPRLILQSVPIFILLRIFLQENATSHAKSIDERSFLQMVTSRKIQLPSDNLNCLDQTKNE